MQQPVQYIGFGGGDLANYWPASYVAIALNAGHLSTKGDLTPAFRYFNNTAALSYEVAVSGSVNSLLAEDIESSSLVSVPVLGQEHALAASSLDSSSEITAPSLVSSAGIDNLLTDNLESNTQTGLPAVGQVHVLASSNVESSSSVASPVLAHIHDLTASSVDSISELSTPTLAASSEHSLLANGIESSAVVSFPVLNRSDGAAGKKKKREAEYKAAFESAKRRKTQRKAIETAIQAEQEAQVSQGKQTLRLKKKPTGGSLASNIEVQRLAAIQDDIDRQLATEILINNIEFKRRESEALALLLLIA